MTKRSFARGAVVTAIAGAAVLGFAGPSQAAGQLVLFDNRNTSGSAHGFESSDANICDLVCASDRASSVENTMSVAWVLYDDSGFGDRRYCIKPGQVINNLHASAWNFGDKISSVRKLGTASCSGYPTF
jgi:hypothetical protein